MQMDQAHLVGGTRQFALAVTMPVHAAGALMLLALAAGASAYPYKFTKKFASSCDAQPARGYGPHPAPKPDT